MATLTPVVATIILSSDSIMPWEIPSLPDAPWPDDAYAHTVFKNTLGAQLADVDAEEVTGEAIRYVFRPDGPQSVADVPAGARFESFVELDDGVFKARHGVVQRSEARFEIPAAPSPPPGPRSFSDDFQRAALGFTWEPLLGQCVIYPNTGLPNGVGCVPGAFFFFATENPGVIRYFRPLHTDNVAVGFTIVLPVISGGSQGRMRVAFCADQRMTSGLAVEVSTETNQLQIARVTGPNTMVYVGTISRTFVQGESFTVRYNDLTKTVSVYAGTSMTPVMPPWVDTAHAVPHGNGYRYLHLSNDPTPGETGAQISGWTAQDEV